MTDQQLLELAAKAAGIVVHNSTDGTIQNRPILVLTAGGGMGTMPYEERWNPLVDDAQALRLAVKLRMDLLFDDKAIEVNATYHPKQIDGETIFPWAWESIEPDVYAATRRAIVKAAAAIAKAESNE